MINDLIFALPEEEGLSSEKVLECLSYIEEWKINVHSFMLVRHGKILAETYAKPFNKDFKHRIYSCSKAYVALAIGKLVVEGKLSLDDKIAAFFPEYVSSSELDEWWRALTIKDVLTMTVPFARDGYTNTQPKGSKFKTEGWAQSFFSGEFPTVKPNGLLFHYNTSGTYQLCVLIEKLTGMSFLDYIRPELISIGIDENIDCVRSPDGYSWGGSGICCTMRDFAKFAELLMNEGAYNGKQIFPRDFIKDMTSKQVDTLFDGGYGFNDGYGYQLWTHPYGFGLCGMASQFVFCFPDKDFMFVCTADTLNTRSAYDDKLYHCALGLYKSLQENSLPIDENSERLSKKLSDFRLISGFGKKTSRWAEKVDGVRYELNENPMGIWWLSLRIDKTFGKLCYENERGVKEIPFGMETYEEFAFPETHYYDTQVYKPANRGLRSLASAAWTSENRLLIRVNIIDLSMGHLGIVLEFKDDLVAVKFTKTAEAYLDEYDGYAIGKKNHGELV